jgi:hypothetical protein
MGGIDVSGWKKPPDMMFEIAGTLLEGRKGGTGLEVCRQGQRWAWKVYRDGEHIGGGLESTLHNAVQNANRRLKGRRVR